MIGINIIYYWGIFIKVHFTFHTIPNSLLGYIKY